ncbi:hypothetical protein BD65_633 [Yersinia ruckeri]|nr:hypothetical protein BD65_633 [Yersinia ruckeri]
MDKVDVKCPFCEQITLVKKHELGGDGRQWQPEGSGCGC